MINLSAKPYFDDYDSSKNFQKILFVPGNPVQARELTQIQSILQNQIKMQGDHVFKNGTMVIPGNVYYDDQVIAIELMPSYDGVVTNTFISELKGTTVISNTDATLIAKIIHAEAGTTDSYPHIFVKYISAGTKDEFIKGEVLTTSNNYTLQLTTTDSYHGKGAICSITEGVFYLNGYFIGVDNQTIVVEYADEYATADIGLRLIEEIITPKDDPSLYDNAMGFSNYSAPGADRLKVSLSLSKMLSTDNQDNFIKLLGVVEGNIQYLNDKTKYAEIEKMLARRTYDESGNYVVTDNIQLNIKHVRNNYRGDWQENRYYLKGDHISYTINNVQYYYYTTVDGFSGNVAPTVTFGTHNDGALNWIQTTTPYFNGGLADFQESPEDNELDDDHFFVEIPAVKAYINGFEVETRKTTYAVEKTRETKFVTTKVNPPKGEYVIVSGLTGSLDFSKINKVDIYDNATSPAVIGSCFVSGIEYYAGAKTQASCEYKLFIFGLEMKKGYDFTLRANKLKLGGWEAIIKKKQVPIKGTVSVLSGDLTQVVGNLTSFLQELTAGSTITIGGVTTTVSSIESNLVMTIPASPVMGAVNSVTLFVNQANYYNDVSSAIIKLPSLMVATVRTEEDLINIKYSVNQYFTGLSTPAGIIEFTKTITNLTDTFNAGNNHLVFDSTGNLVDNVTFAYTDGYKSLTVGGLPLDGSNPSTYTMVAVIDRIADASKEKQKVRSIKTVTLKSDGLYLENGTLKYSNFNFNSKKINLSEADVTRIISVTQSGGGSTDPYTSTGETDITDRYILDINQADSHYGVAKIRLKNPNQHPTSPIKIRFEYFEHPSSGDFFTKSSYSGVVEEAIPYLFGSSVGDIIDFRPRTDDTGEAFDTLDGASLAPSLNSNQPVEVSYSYYLGRADLLCLNQKGDIIYMQGLDDDIDHVEYPKPPADALVLAKISVVPNFQNPILHLAYEFEKYKRYTMKDIGKMDERLNRVEEYVLLNMLEKQTADMSIKDEFGFDRYKNGFLTDSFVDDSLTGDINQLKCTINGQIFPTALTPEMSTEFLPCVENQNTTEASRVKQHYQITGSQLTLPYDVVPIIDQKIASSSEFINPFDVVVFEGNMDLYPDKDTWTSKSVTDKYNYI